jgi:ABC-type multidrug transport system ATPase subunit
MLEISGLSKTYSNGVKAIDGVSLKIGTGMFGLLGPNGAGKSSLMRTIATLQEPDSGSIRFDGLDVLREKDRMRGALGYLPQEFGVYPNNTAEELLNHLAVLKGIVDRKERRHTVESLLEMTNLSAHRGKKLGGYSGGMKQRFGIAQALLGNPRLIIVDEPTAGLDPEERDRFHNLLSRIGENVSVILSTHIVSDVTDLCQNMAIINNGRVLFQGSPQEAMRALEGKVWKKVLPRTEAEELAGRMKVISSRLTQGQTMLHVISSGAPGAGFESVAPDLEDVYFTHIRGFLQ